MNIYLVLVITLIVVDYAANVVVDLLNLQRAQGTVPDEFEGWYDAEKYATSQRYLRETTRFSVLSDTLLTPLYLAFILFGGFHVVDEVARSAGGGLIPTGLLFAGILMVASQVVQLPFSIYSTFVLEARYGFNRTTVGTFVADRVKGLLLTLLLGGVAFSGVLWFFAETGSWAWLYAWGALVVLQVLVLYVAPVVIMPLFNKFTPLPDGELRDAIRDYAAKEGFQLRGIFTTDGSRRSSKSNAYFTGFGRWRRVVLYDTLIEKHPLDELVSVLAHEVGHYKLKHVAKHLAISVTSMGLMLWVLSWFIMQPGLYEAFGLEMKAVGAHPPIYAGMVFFGFLYAPISMVLSVLQNMSSRRYEFGADAFAASTYGRPEAMVTALKRLTVDHLGNLTPHPLKVFLEYSHPPVLERIHAIRRGSEI